jgi:hypothetical protein
MFRASDSASGKTSSCTALSRSTSAIESRQNRQRLVTSFSDAARWAASSPKICQVSRPASRTALRFSPSIHRAIVIVELVPIRSKLS